MVTADLSALILLSTFNGEKYLSAQLDSLIEQTITDWSLLVRDDGSSDSTIDIIKKYCEKDPRIIYFTDDFGNLNIQKSFSLLMQHALTRHENFIFFCDQDDVWLPNKLALQLGSLKQLENEYGSETPALIHSDLCVVDSHLKIIHPSYLTFERMTRNTVSPLQTLLINNFVTGCTLGMNSALLQMAYPIPENTFMHDWWCALCAAAHGKITFVDQVTLLYRQHADNSVGSKGFNKKFNQLINLKTFKNKKLNFKLCFTQAHNLLTRTDTTHTNFNLIKEFSSLPNKNLIARYIAAYKLQLKPSNYMRALVFWLLLGSL